MEPATRSCARRAVLRGSRATPCPSSDTVKRIAQHRLPHVYDKSLSKHTLACASSSRYRRYRYRRRWFIEWDSVSERVGAIHHRTIELGSRSSSVHQGTETIGRVMHQQRLHGHLAPIGPDSLDTLNVTACSLLCALLAHQDGKNRIVSSRYMAVALHDREWRMGWGLRARVAVPPGTPAASTPGTFIVASIKRTCSGGSIGTPASSPMCRR